MIRQLNKYLSKLQSDGSADLQEAAILAKDDHLLKVGNEDLYPLGQAIIEKLNIISLVIAKPPLPFVDLLLNRIPESVDEIVPQDTETRTFLHDIPIVRQQDFSLSNVEQLINKLGQRKGVLVEGVGIVAVGSVTVEQAYINYSSVYHALFVKFLLMLLTDEQCPADEEVQALAPLWEQLEKDIPDQSADLSNEYLKDKQVILQAMDQVGKKTVELKLVDSFFGNISTCLGDVLYISQTGASLDELSGCIDRVPNDNSSTAGITASSELIAHRAIFEQTGARTILHGHPKFSVILSLICNESDCKITDCWKECDKIRYLDDIPVVAGEVGAGGIAKKVPPVIGNGVAVVYGHGVFAIGQQDFRQPLRSMIELENWCRKTYRHSLFERCLNDKARSNRGEKCE